MYVLANSILFQCLENLLHNSVLFQYRVGTLKVLHNSYSETTTPHLYFYKIKTVFDRLRQVSHPQTHFLVTQEKQYGNSSLVGD